jgi:hypothetical protein
MRKTVLLAILVLIPMSSVDAQVPTSERSALIALYDATDGSSWTDNSGWLGPFDTECTWFGITCEGVDYVTSIDLHANNLSGSLPPELADLPHLRQIKLYSNQLTGSIPSHLGDLSSLERLHLYDNQLTGSIPPELANSTTLLELYLQDNQLSGSIPPELGASQLVKLRLNNNQLSGSIPAELGSATTLRTLLLSSNILHGEIPVELENLTDLLGFNISWNALHSDDASLVAFLDSKQSNWRDTQTVAPENVAVDSVGDHTVWLSWDAVSYQTDPGGYEVFSSPTGTGVWTSGGWTESKTTTAFPVTGLDPSTSYDFVVGTSTDPHACNLNLVTSDPGAEVMATTAGTGCAQPVIVTEGPGPFTLSVTASYDSYTWSTAETTPSIVVGPPYGRWIWVTVTSSGGCEETAATAVGVAPILALIFEDDFESGGTTEWSSSVQ